MSESPLLTSAKNNPLARGDCRPLDGGHDNACLLALATAHCLASSRLGWTHHSPVLMGGGRCKPAVGQLLPGAVLRRYGLFKPGKRSWFCFEDFSCCLCHFDTHLFLRVRLARELMNLFPQSLKHCMCCSLIGCVYVQAFRRLCLIQTRCSKIVSDHSECEIAA